MFNAVKHDGHMRTKHNLSVHSYKFVSLFITRVTSVQKTTAGLRLTEPTKQKMRKSKFLAAGEVCKAIF